MGQIVRNFGHLEAEITANRHPHRPIHSPTDPLTHPPTHTLTYRPTHSHTNFKKTCWINVKTSIKAYSKQYFTNSFNYLNIGVSIHEVPKEVKHYDYLLKKWFFLKMINIMNGLKTNKPHSVRLAVVKVSLRKSE